MTAPDVLLEVRDLEVAYGDAQALAGVSFHVAPGEIVSMVGGNGAGKTTAIRTIAGMVRARSGEIRYRGRSIVNVPSYRVGELGIAQVAEGRQIFPNLSVEENLDLGAVLRRARPTKGRWLERVYGLFPRLRERRRQRAGTLSGGEQQMLAIGRALMANPEFVMFDEPSLGLAPALVEEVFGVIRDLHRNGLTILLVEQNVAESLALCHRAYVLETGRIVAAGRGAELLDEDRIRQAYLGL